MPTWVAFLLIAGMSAIIGAMTTSRGEWARTRAWQFTMLAFLIVVFVGIAYIFFWKAWYWGICVCVVAFLCFGRAGMMMEKSINRR